MPKTMTLKEMCEERATCLKDARELVDAKNGDLTAEDRQKSDELLDRATELTTQIDAVNDSANREDRLKELEAKLEEPGNRRTPPGNPGTDGASATDGRPFVVTWQSKDIYNRRQERKAELSGPRATGEYATAFNRYLAGGERALTQEQMTALQATNTLQSDSDERGGYLVPPEQFVAELIQELDDEVFFRQMARQFTVRRAKSLGAPKRTAKASTFVWAAEIEEPTDDASLKFGKRNLYPHYATGAVPVSRDLLRSSAMPVDEIVRGEIARDGGELQELGFLLGTGHEQPLGVFVASPEGISTSRDVSQGNDADSPTYDGLVHAKYSLKGKYMNRAQWMFHRDGVKKIALLKDGEGRPLWMPSMRDGEPDRILNLPFRMSEFVPNTFTTGKYVGILGDFSFYWIADALDIELLRLDELKALSNQVVFLARLKVDGMPVVEEAFARVKLG